MTATPIQNNLDELFVIVDFVSPGLLGTLSEFRRKYNVPIGDAAAGNGAKKKAAEASDELNAILQSVMIRRTHADVTSGVLPPRLDIVISCALTEPQREKYDEIADFLCR